MNDQPPRRSLCCRYRHGTKHETGKVGTSWISVAIKVLNSSGLPAAAACLAALRFDPDRVMICSPLYNAPTPLSQASAKIDMTQWPAPMIRMYLGRMPPEAVLAAADDPDAKKKKKQVCETNFYSGEWALRQGAKDEAARRFRLAASGCPKDATEWFAANAELKALGAAP